MIVAGFVFIAAMIAMELATGIAVFGFTGGKAVVQRDQEAGKFWFSIALQVVFGLILPAVLYFGGFPR